MYVLFPTALVLIAFGALAWEFLARMRNIRAAETSAIYAVSSDRYRPMLRLLSDEDLAFVPGNTALSRTLRARRRQLFRGYLNCLTRDYAHLLAGVRAAMAASGADRPELARALAKNRMLFACAICKVELRLALHAAGIGKVDVSALVEAMDRMSAQVRAMSAPPMVASGMMAAG
jgi:hypothetical protein